MWYLFFQIWLWLLAAFVLGWLSHWFFCCRSKAGYEKTTVTKPSETPLLATTSNAINAQQTSVSELGMPADETLKPQGFSARPDQVDDLKRIKGIGAVLEETLNDLGVFQFTQIADWDLDNVIWVDSFLSFPGRIEREDWIAQARTLASGGTTEFSSKVDKGDVDY